MLVIDHGGIGPINLRTDLSIFTEQRGAAAGMVDYFAYFVWKGNACY